MDLRLRDRTAVVTGGSSGIGLATVRLLLAEGVNVVSCSRGRDRLEASVQQLEDEGLPVERLTTVVCDVTDAQAVEELAGHVRDRFGALDILVNNAGQGRFGRFTSTTDDDWQAELHLKYFSVIRPTRALLPLLQASDAGSIVVVNSLWAREPDPEMVATSAARAGVLNLVKTMSREFAPTVRVNTVLIGTVRSGQWHRRYAALPNPEQSEADWLIGVARDKGIPMDRVGEPDEAAAAIVFLSSPVAGFTTGARLEVTGGVARAV
ncbi:SDR family oxidoreductase [Kribbella sp. NPDC026611]|uniref:SDR family oxidoreductase n=1 Tax=Kribbella sp. NPDC026611 TaxID=3154911 RepID=UPI0033F6E06E